MTGRSASHDEMALMRGQEFEEISQISDRVRQRQSMNIKMCPLMSFSIEDCIGTNTSDPNKNPQQGFGPSKDSNNK